MCGIAGIVSPSRDDFVDKAILTRMVDALHHRGPDDQGTWLGDGLGLGMSRLSIIDLITGKQPISSEDENVWVVFNGEIYNFSEVKRDLEARGHRFRTKSDTEVLVHLWEEYGPSCLDHLNGMFAIALWDRTAETLFLARDRMGEKPLYFAEASGFFLFASELKALLQHPAIAPRLNIEALNAYLTLEYVPAPHTILEGVHKLLPAHYLLWRNNSYKVSEYWDLPLGNGAISPVSEEAIAGELLERMRESVKKRLLSDVPLGVLLSGGMDSSTVAALMQHVSAGPVESFTIGFEDPTFDESAHARAVAGFLGTNHHERILSSRETLQLIPKITEILDEPLGDASIIPTYLLSHFARERVTVALGGDGGDELFAGYPTYLAHRIAQVYARLPSALRRSTRSIINRLPVSTGNISLDFQAKRFVSAAEEEPVVRNSIWMGSFRPEEKLKLFSDETRLALEGRDGLEDLRRVARGLSGIPLLPKMLYVDAKFYLQDDILVKVDRASMAASLEVRAPFLDHTLVEYVTRLPPHVKARGRHTKYILRKAMADHLPASILGRKKKGFGIPVARWLKDDLRDWSLDLLSPERIRAQGLFSHTYIEKALDDHFAGRADNRKQLWTLLVFQGWMERYLSNGRQRTQQ